MSVFQQGAEDLVIVRTSPENPEPDSRASDESLIRTALDRWRLADEAEREIRLKAMEDLRFFAGDQWPAEIREQRAIAGRPCLELNRLPELVSVIVNQQRQAKPQIQINPRGGGATLEMAQIMQGLVRHIEVSSDAERAYDWAFQYAVISGFPGYIRVITEYVDADTFDQQIRIKRVLNPFSIYMDPGAQEMDASDAKWCLVVEDISHDEFKRRYPNSELAGLRSMSSLGDREPNWFTRESIRIAEYWHIETVERTLVALSDGSAVFEEDLTPDASIAVGPDGPIRRTAQVPQVYCDIISAAEVLERHLWPGRYIPIVPVIGEELYLDGKRILSGMVRFAKDAQRQYNYFRSALAEAIALAPKAPFVAEWSQIEGFEEIWKAANRNNVAVLPYRAVTSGGQLVPPPQRQFGEAAIGQIAAAIQLSDQDLKATTRIREPLIGLSSGEQSGRAIRLRQAQGSLANFAYMDNLARSIQHVGRIIVDLAPKIYDRPGRLIRIIRPDSTSVVIPLKQQVQEREGVIKFYDLSSGTYDVTISVGPGYETRRQEFVESVMQLIQTAPQVAQYILHLVVRNMDWPGAEQIAEQLERLLPAHLRSQKPDEDGSGGAELPPEWKEKFAQLMQQHQALTEQLNAAKEIISNRRMEIESRERIAALQEQTKLMIAELKAQSSESIERLRQQVASIDQKLNAFEKYGLAAGQ